MKIEISEKDAIIIDCILKKSLETFDFGIIRHIDIVDVVNSFRKNIVENADIKKIEGVGIHFKVLKLLE